MEADGAKAQWERTVAALREGTSLYLTNDFLGAEKIFKAGMERPSSRAPAPASGVASMFTSALGLSARPDEDSDGDGDGGEARDDDRLEARDTRGAFALQFAVVGLMRGVASLANDQLDECLARLWEADALAAQDTAWVGRKVTRGVCTLVAGVVQCLQRNAVKGVYNILRSWQWIRCLRTEALGYAGVGSEVIRSASLFALGDFALILSLLPAHLIRAASWTTGFEIDRETGLGMLRTCQAEGGIYAPLAALALLAWSLDTKTFLGEPQTREELADCAALLEWGEAAHRDSVFFSILRADHHACRHDLAAASAVLAATQQLPCLVELRALSAVLSYKQALYHLATLDLVPAAAAFARSLDVYRAAGRRSLCPAMAAYAAMAYLVDDTDVSRASADAMLSVLEGYARLPKTNWGHQDRGAFRVLEQHKERAAAGPSRAWRRGFAMIHLAQAMTIFMRVSWWMADAPAAAFVALLQAEPSLTSADDRARRAMCVAQLHSHRGETALGLAACDEGLAVEGLSEAALGFGVPAMLHALRAQLFAAAGEPHKAAASLQASAAGGRKVLMQHHIAFKTARLRGVLGLQLADAYTPLSLPRGTTASVTARLVAAGGAGGAECVAEWDWAVEARDVDFSATFTPDAPPSSPLVVVATARHMAADGPVEGRFALPAGCRGGRLELRWSNAFSYLRSKAISYRLVLPDDAEAPAAVLS